MQFQKIHKLYWLLTLTPLLLIPIILTNCGGGGGGGDDFLGAALVSIDANPQLIDTRDRTLVVTEVREVHENGIYLKFRYPKGLQYVTDSALLEVDGQEIDVAPEKNVAVDPYDFLVFIFPQSSFGDDNYGKLSFELVGKAAVADGRIEVDPDVDDLLIENPREFNSDSPAFGAEDKVKIEVED